MREEPILLDEEPLTESFIPTRLMHREAQLKEIINHIKPALHGKDARNVLVTGGTSTGKTSLVKWILKEHFERKHAYVNCLNCRSEHKILESILIQLGHVIPENKPTDYLAQRFSKKVGKDTIACLDEVDQIKDDRILQTLSVQQCGLILITSRPFFFDDVDDRMRSRLFLAEIEFPQYSQSELIDIMRERAQYAFSPSTVSNRVLELIAAWAKGDARIALQTLRVAAMSADNKKREEITIDDLKEAFRSARKSKRDYVKSKLNEHQRFLLGTIEERKSIMSGELFELYQNSFPQPLGERTYRNQMEHLVQTGLVRDIGEGRWKSYEVVA